MQQSMKYEENDDVETCCNLFTWKVWTLDEIETSMDNNDQYVNFRAEGTDKFFQPPPTLFYSSSYALGNSGCFLVKKISSNGNCSILLTYKNVDGKRVLLNGSVLLDDLQFKVKEFIVTKKRERIENGDISYEHVPTCVLQMGGE
jgi:hypothetical protein